MSWPSRKSVLVPIDFSDASFAALEEALTMVDAASRVHAIHVLPDMTTEAQLLREVVDPRDRESRVRDAFEKHLGDRAHQDVNVSVRTGDAGTQIVEAAEELGCDLIVIPSHGRSGLSRLFLGSVAERVLRMAPCPVLVLRRPHES